MKKLLIIITVLVALILTAAIKPVTTYQYWYKARQYFSLNPIIKNSGGTDTDTLATMAYSRANGAGGVSGDYVTTETFTAFVADTITLQAAMIEYIATLPTYADNAAAYAAIGADKLFFTSAGILTKSYEPE